MRNVEIPGATQQLLNGKPHDFLAIFAVTLKNQRNCIIFVVIILEVFDYTMDFFTTGQLCRHFFSVKWTA